MGDHQYQQPDYQGPQQPQQVQQVHYVQQGPPPPQQQQYHQGPPPPPQQQEQVIYQTLQTPHQQQQQQPPQYTRVVIARPQQPQHHGQQPPHQYHHQQQPAQQQQQHYQYQPQQQQRHQYQAPPQQQQQQQQQYQYVHHQQQQQQQQQTQPHQGQQPRPPTIRIVSGPNAIPVAQGARVYHANAGGVGPDGKPRFVIRAVGQQQGQFVQQRGVNPQQGQRPRILHIQQGVRPNQQQFRMQGVQQRQPHVPQHGGQQRGPITVIQRHPAQQQGQVRFIRQPMQPQQQNQMHYISAPPQRPPLPQHQPPPPPPPPPQSEPQPSEIQYNIEHVFEENGKQVRKMPINLNGQTIWVDCADHQPAESNNSVMLDLDTGNTVTSSSANNEAAASPPSLPKPVQSRRSIKDLTEEEKNQIIEDCCVRLISPQILSNRYNVSVQGVRTLVKDSGNSLPAKYNSKAEHTSKSRPPSQPGALAKNPEETITVYSAPPEGGDHSPPAQVVRHQLVVTDNKNPINQNGMPSQLQLPQKPTPPTLGNLPKPVPAQAKVPALPVQAPKIIPGKVALCPNCGGYSVHIDRCTNCKKITKEGAKILPDPDYKPPPSSSISSDDSKKTPQDLRNIRIQPKAGRLKKTNNDEPECIALSSDEDEGGEENDAENASEGSGERTSNNETSSSVNESGDKSEGAKTDEGKSKLSRQAF